jgi:hypothetical protein
MHGHEHAQLFGLLFLTPYLLCRCAAYPMHFIQELCEPRGEAPEEGGSREGFIAMLLSMPAVEEACDAAAAAVKPLLDSARECSKVLWCPPSLPQQTF